MRVAVLGLVVVASAACSRSHEIKRDYGRSFGTSINGTRVFRDGIAARGNVVRRATSIDHRYVHRADVLVYFAPDEAPLDVEALYWLDDWLTERAGRTLVFVGHDFDADMHLFEDLAGHLADAGDEDLAFEASARHRLARHELELRTADPPETHVTRYPLAWSDALPESSYPAPLGALGDPPAPVPPGEGEAVAEEALVRPADGPRVYLRHHPRLHADGPPTPRAVDPEAGDDGSDARDEPTADRLESLGYVLHEPVRNERVARAAAGRPLVSVRSVSARTGGESQVILVANASFLLNYSLVDPDHRDLAGGLIDELGTGRDVVFFEPPPPGSGGSWLWGDKPFTGPSPLEALTKPPMGWVFLHFLIAGLLLLLARSAWLGRRRSEPDDPVVPFADHVRAYGRLLERSGDTDHATRLIEDYRAVGHRTDPRTGR